MKPRSRGVPRRLLAALATLSLVSGATQAEQRPLAASVIEYLDQAADGGAFSGVVLVGLGDQIVVHQARGFADFELGVPLAVDHILRFGSLSKPITASAVLRLVERGELDLGASVCRWVERCPETWQPVTLHHLLSHSSGLPDYFGDLDAVPVEETATEIERLLAGLPAAPPLEEPPGTSYAYRNFNYVLLGHVLERTTGLYWEDVLIREVLGPLNLSTLRYDDVFEILPGRAHGYTREDGELRNIEYDDHAAYAAGGLRGRASDLFTWLRALVGGRILGRPWIERSFEPNLGDYGYGWGIRGYFGRPIVSHTGGTDGFSAVLMLDREADLSIVVLSNVESDAAILRACDLLRLAVERPDRIDAPAWLELEPRARCGLEGPA